MQKHHWDPTVARRVAEERAQQERDQAARLNAEPRWRRGRLRDVVGARYLALEIKSQLDEALAAHDLGPETAVWPLPSCATRRNYVDAPTGRALALPPRSYPPRSSAIGLPSQRRLS